MKRLKMVPFAVAAALCMSSVAADEWISGTDEAAVQAVLEASFTARNEAQLDRLEQSYMQKVCSKAEMTGEPVPQEAVERIQAEAKESIVFPADGEFLGDWREGEKIAQSGRGMQYSDKPGAPRGGNCFACHEMTKSEISFGNIGTSLLHYGKLRGTSKEILEYAWTRIYNPHAFSTCSVMPRFGDAGILTEEQLKHVMAFLFDPTSPVNDDTVVAGK